MLLLWLLDEPSIKQLKTWAVLRERFLNQYRTEILQYCGFDTGRWPIERIKVNNPALFIGYLSAMQRCQMLETSYEELADYIDLVFDTGYKVNTICNQLKAAYCVFYDVFDEVKNEYKQSKNKQSDN